MRLAWSLVAFTAWRIGPRLSAAAARGAPDVGGQAVSHCQQRRRVRPLPKSTTFGQCFMKRSADYRRNTALLSCSATLRAALTTKRPPHCTWPVGMRPWPFGTELAICYGPGSPAAAALLRRDDLAPPRCELLVRTEVAASLRDATAATGIKGAPVPISVAALTNIVLNSLVVARVKICGVALLAIALLGLGAGAVVTAGTRGAAARSTRCSKGDGRGGPDPDKPGRSLWQMFYRRAHALFWEVCGFVTATVCRRAASIRRTGVMSSRPAVSAESASGTRPRARSSARSVIPQIQVERSRSHPMVKRWRRSNPLAGSSSGTSRLAESSVSGISPRTNTISASPFPPAAGLWPQAASLISMKPPRR